MIQISEWGWIWKRWFNTKFTPQILVLHNRVIKWLKWTHIVGSNDWYNTFGVIFRFKPRYLVQTWTWTLWYNQALVVTMSWYAVPQKHIQLLWFHHMQICTVLNWLITMQLHTQIIENRATVYPIVKLHIQLYTHFQAGKSSTEWGYDNCVSWCCDLVPAPTSWWCCIGLQHIFTMDNIICTKLQIKVTF